MIVAEVKIFEKGEMLEDCVINEFNLVVRCVENLVCGRFTMFEMNINEIRLDFLTSRTSRPLNVNSLNESTLL